MSSFNCCFRYLILALCAVAAFSKQEPQLDATARARIEQARASIVTIKVLDQSDQTVSQSLGFFIRKDLVATDGDLAHSNSRLQLVTATPARTIKVVSPGHYFLPYVLVEAQAEVPPLSLGDSDRIGLNDAVYTLDDSGKIVAGAVTSVTTIRNTRAFLISIPIDAKNTGAPLFNRNGEVIGMATKSPDGQSAGLAWPSEVLAMMQHLGEPGVGIGSGTGPRFREQPNATSTAPPAAATVDTKPAPLHMPPPRYTEAARANRTQGDVVLRALVREDGSVDNVQIIRGLPDGLNDQAIAAARLSKFKPAMKDGKPVPYWVVLHMNFTIR